MIIRKRQTNRTHSLKKDITICLSTITVLILIVSSFLNYEILFNILNERTQNESKIRYNQITYTLDSMMAEVNILLSSIYEDDNLQSYLSPHTSEPSTKVISLLKFEDMIMDYFSRYKYLDSISIFSESGLVIGINRNLVVTSIYEKNKIPFFQTDIYQSTLLSYPNPLYSGGNTISNVSAFFAPEYEKYITSKKSIAITRYTKPDSKNILSGTIVINLTSDFLGNAISHLRNINNHRIFITDKNKTIIYSTNEDEIGTTHYFSDNTHVSQPFSTTITSTNNGIVQRLHYHLPQYKWAITEEIYLSEYNKDINKIRYSTLLILGTTFLLIMVLTYFTTNKITRQLTLLTCAMDTMMQDQLDINVPVISHNELGYLTSTFNRMSHHIYLLVEENKRIEEQKCKHEIQLLRSQINPHFIYNTINTVRWMAQLSNTPNIADCLTSFNSLLRPIFKNPKEFIFISEEIQFTKHYINIMNYRYGNAIHLILHVSPDCSNYYILQFIIQPILENSILHGMDLNSNDFTITLTIRVDALSVFILIEDNGIGMDDLTLQNIRSQLSISLSQEIDTTHGIGLCNINQRLYSYYHTNYHFEITSVAGRGSTFRIEYPITNTKNN